jgi:dihydrofolate reductase
MRKLIVLSFVSLDGVMQAPGGPQEDTSGGFTHGGWSVGYWDDTLAATMGEQMGHPFDLLLGRKTYDVFASAWPKIDASSPINSCKKYVVTRHPIPADTEVWKNSIKVDGNIAEKIKQLKKENGNELQVHGSTQLIQLLLQHDLVDEFWLKIYPVTLGKGKRLFGTGTIPAGFKLMKSSVSPSGVIIASYVRDGKVKVGSFEIPGEKQIQ